ncbi:MAG: YfhO family protein [Limisphaerales bacterium]
MTNTRYLLGAAGFLDAMNQQLDPDQHRFRIVQRFGIVPKPGIIQPTRFEELTAVPDANGPFALFEFTGALPRAKLYSNWQVNTNDQVNLNTLADLNFDPAKTVLISTPQTGLPASATNENSGTVEFKSYSPKHIIFSANSQTPSVLLLNDKYDPNWRVTVDGKPAELLRCNYIMRGVYLPAGTHTVEFQFSLPLRPMYITLTAIATGIVLISLLIFLQRRKPAIQL